MFLFGIFLAGGITILHAQLNQDRFYMSMSVSVLSEPHFKVTREIPGLSYRTTSLYGADLVFTTGYDKVLDNRWYIRHEALIGLEYSTLRSFELVYQTPTNEFVGYSTISNSRVYTHLGMSAWWQGINNKHFQFSAGLGAGLMGLFYNVSSGTLLRDDNLDFTFRTQEVRPAFLMPVLTAGVEARIPFFKKNALLIMSGLDHSPKVTQYTLLQRKDATSTLHFRGHEKFTNLRVGVGYARVIKNSKWFDNTYYGLNTDRRPSTSRGQKYVNINWEYLDRPLLETLEPNSYLDNLYIRVGQVQLQAGREYFLTNRLGVQAGGVLSPRFLDYAFYFEGGNRPAEYRTDDRTRFYQWAGLGISINAVPYWQLVRKQGWGVKLGTGMEVMYQLPGTRRRSVNPFTYTDAQGQRQEANELTFEMNYNRSKAPVLLGTSRLKLEFYGPDDPGFFIVFGGRYGRTPVMEGRFIVTDNRGVQREDPVVQFQRSWWFGLGWMF